MTFFTQLFFAKDWNVLPFAQLTANSHRNAGPFIGTIYFIIAAFLVLFFISRLPAKTNPVFLFGALFFITTFIFWGYKLFHLYCEGCMACG
jgi:hypothetical protein